MNAPGESQSAPVVRRARQSDAALLGEIFGDAFVADPLFTWLDPKSRFPEYLFGLLAKNCCLKHNEVYITEDGSGAAMWLPPGVTLRSLAWRNAAALGWRLFADCGFSGIRRILAMEKCLEKDHPVGPHAYLVAIGVRPAHAGQGIGSTLLRQSLAHCDGQRLPACLETANPKNLPLYERFGFAVTAEARLPLGGPAVWFMVRKAVAIQEANTMSNSLADGPPQEVRR